MECAVKFLRPLQTPPVPASVTESFPPLNISHVPLATFKMREPRLRKRGSLDEEENS